MKSESIAEVIFKKRVQERRSSLGKLELLTGKNRATIRRYEMGEAPIPSDVAKKLASAYFETKKSAEDFLQQWKEELNDSKEEAKERRKRKKQCTKARQIFDIRFQVGPINGYSRKNESVKNAWISVGVYNKKNNKLVLVVDPGAFVYLDQMREKDKLRFKKDAINALIEHSSKLKLGKFAVIDLIRHEIEKSDIFNIETYENTKNTGKLLLLDEKSFDEISSLVEEKKCSTSIEDLRECLQSIDVYLNYIRSRGSDMSAYKSKLLNKVQFMDKLIEEQLTI